MGNRAERFELLWGWAKGILFVGAVGAIIWSVYFQPGEEPPTYFELQDLVAASQTCDELTTAHDAALETHDVGGIDDQQMNTLWRSVLDKAEVIRPGASTSTQLRCTGVIGRCPRNTPPDICADLLSEEWMP